MTRTWTPRTALALLLLSLLAAEATAVAPSDASTAAIPDSLLSSLQWRPIGPAVMGGRIADIAAVDGDTFYVGAATGNLWKTNNRGTTWETFFDREEVNSIGDVTLAPSNPNVVWIGTGEANNRQSSPWGGGVYRSTDGGTSWSHVGLAETRHIGRIVVHPNDPDTAWVAAGGNLWAPSEERGVFRTRDGGATWDKLLYVDEHTGATDLVMHPTDPDTLLVAMYQRQRSACCFIGGGPGSGIYRSSDGGDTWDEVTEGLPEGHKGRIGLDFYRADGHVVYATIEAAGEGRGVYRSADTGMSWEKISETNPRPMYFSQIRVDPTDSSRIYVLGVRLHVSDDGGRTFRDDGASSVHSDHHAMWIDPNDSDHLIMGSDGGVTVSFDRAATWRALDNLNLGQFYEIGVDMQDPYWVYGGLQDNGSWGGPSNSLDRRGIRNADWFNVHGGDGFYTRVDPRDSNILFAESQNGNLSRLDLTTMERQAIRPTPMPGRANVSGAEPDLDDDGEPAPYRWNWNAPVLISAHDPATIYYGGNYLFRSRDRGLTWEEMSPDLTRAIDRGEEELMGMKPGPRALSRNDGISSYGNITTLSESPLDAGALYVGSDDGNVQRTLNGGVDWTDLTETFPGLPERTYVSRVAASSSVPGRVYASFDNHYHGDFAPYVYVSEDNGDTWRPITNGLPEWSVNVIVEHPRTPDLLFLGNELGVYFSIDRGTSWKRLQNNLPSVPVDDIVVHPSTNDLVIGTHGRSVWIIDDIAPLQHLAAAQAAERFLFPVRDVITRNVNSPQGWVGDSEFRAPNPPSGAIIRYRLSEAAAAEATSEGDDVAEGGDESEGDDEPQVELTVRDASGRVVRTLEGPAAAGSNQVIWNLRTDPPYEPEEQQQGRGRGGFRFGGAPPGMLVLPGEYHVELEGAEPVSMRMALDPRVQISEADLQLRQATIQKSFEFAKPYNNANREATRLNRQIAEAKEQIARFEGASEDLSSMAEEVGGEVADIRQALQGMRRLLFAAFAAERVSARPTEDQIYSIDRARRRLPPLIEQLNAVIGARLPALYARMNEEGIRANPGELIAVPDWQR